MLIHPKIEIVQGDMFDLEAQNRDAIVNPTDDEFSGLGPLDSLIHQKAGISLKEDLSKIENCKYGDAVITKGYNLSFQFIIHTINPSWLISKDKKIVKRLLETCYENCLQVAEENQVKRIIFPALSTGNRAFPFFIAADIAVFKVSTYLDENLSSNIQKIIFVANSDEIYKSFIIRDIQEQRDYLDQQYRNLRAKKLLFEKGMRMIKDTVRENQEKNKILKEKNEILNDLSTRLKKQTNIAVHERDIQRLKTRELEKITNELTEKNQLINRQKDELFEKTQVLEALMEELRRQKESIEEKNQELVALSEELRQQNEVVEQKNIELQSLQSTKDLMISAINHDLRNPLNPIINYSSSSFPNPDKEKLLQKIHFRSKRMKAMVEEVMYIYQADKLELQTTSVQLRKTVQSAITLIADFQTQMPEIRNEVPENSYARYNEDYIRRVIENLLVNAVKYSNGVDSPLIVLRAETQGDQVRLSIRDNGWGIPPDKLRALQEGVQQFETRQQAGEKSFGIGLRFCTTILRLHETHLEIHSEGEDQGSTFAFVLPLVQSHTQNPSLTDADFDLEASIQNLALSPEIKAHWQPHLPQLQNLDLYDAELGEILQEIEKNHQESHTTIKLFKECIKLDEENLYQTLLSKLTL